MYNIGDKFYFDDDYKNKAKFCNENNYRIVVLGKDEKGTIYQIQDQPLPTEEEILQALREQRESECFSIINRGQLWYNSLTEEQLTELQVWYMAWLDVTETKIIPTKPSWLK
jgi:hypothetical protein